MVAGSRKIVVHLLMMGVAILLFGVLLTSLGSQNATGAITFLDINEEPLNGTVDFRVNATCNSGPVDEVILTIDDDTANSRTLDHLANETWVIRLETFDLTNGNHTFKITSTSGDTAESRTINHSVFNPVRILFPELPEKASGFLVFEAQVMDDRLDSTNVWYSVDAGSGLIFPFDRENRFQVIVDVEGLQDGMHEFSVKAINVDNVVTMRAIQVEVANNETDIHILPSFETEKPGLNGTYRLQVLAGGLEARADNVCYGVDNQVWGVIPYRQGHLYSLYVPTSNLSKGSHQLFVQIKGPGGMLYATDETEIFAQGPDEDEFPLLLFGVSLILVFLGTFIVFTLVTRKQIITPQDAFLIYYTNGVLMKHLNLAEWELEEGLVESDKPVEKPDQDLVTSMLMAIQDFVETSFASGEEGVTSALRQIAFGDSTILLEKSEKIVLSLVVPAQPKELDLNGYEKFLMGLIDEIEENYRAKLEGWDGDRSNLGGMEDLLAKVFHLGRGGLGIRD